MMDSMRNAAKGWAAKLLIGLLVVSFAVWGIADWLPNASRQPLASVGDTDITADEFSQACSNICKTCRSRPARA